MPISDIVDTSVGVSVFMPTMAFEAEVGRRSAVTIFRSMDEDFEEYEIEDNANHRISEVMISVKETIELMQGGELDPEEAVSEIAYAFLYGFLKQQETPSLDGVRGIVGYMINDTVYFQRCDTEEEFVVAVAQAREHMNYDTNKLLVNPYFGKKPTIH